MTRSRNGRHLRKLTVGLVASDRFVSVEQLSNLVHIAVGPSPIGGWRVTERSDQVRLDELRRILTESSAQAWSKLDSDGPLYRYNVSMVSQPGSQAIPQIDWHHSGAVYRDDVDLTIQWGLDVDSDRDSNDLWNFEWASNFTSPKVHPYFVDVFWRGTLVDRYAVIGVDGGRGLVPFPRTTGEEPNWYDVVTKREVAVAALVTDLGGLRLSMFDYYLDKAGFTVVPDGDGPLRTSENW